MRGLQSPTVPTIRGSITRRLEMQEWNKCASGAWRMAFAGMVVAMLAGCAGTIKRDDAQPQQQAATTARVPGVVKVVARLSPEATKQQEDNRQFNRDEL